MPASSTPAIDESVPPSTASATSATSPTATEHDAEVAQT
jgi:hypothetical protein